MRTITLHIEAADLPEGVHGFSGMDAEKPGTFYIAINAANTAKKQEETFIHEMLHIWRGDHDKGGQMTLQEFEKLERQTHTAARDYCRREGK